MKGGSALKITRDSATFLGASLDLSGRATRTAINGRYTSKSAASRSDWQAIGGDFDRAIGRAADRIKG